MFVERGTKPAMAVCDVGFFGTDGIVFAPNGVKNLVQPSIGSVIHLGSFAVVHVRLEVYNTIAAPLAGHIRSRDHYTDLGYKSKRFVRWEIVADPW